MRLFAIALFSVTLLVGCGGNNNDCPSGVNTTHPNCPNYTQYPNGQYPQQQYPGQYPQQYPGQYPQQYPGQYPQQYPGQYPYGQYPQYPPYR